MQPRGAAGALDRKQPHAALQAASDKYKMPLTLVSGRLSVRGVQPLCSVEGQHYSQRCLPDSTSRGFHKDGNCCNSHH